MDKPNSRNQKGPSAEDPPKLPTRVIDVDRILKIAGEAGLVAAVQRTDLSPSELNVLALLADFAGTIPGAEKAARLLAERPHPEHRKRYKVAGIKR